MHSNHTRPLGEWKWTILASALVGVGALAVSLTSSATPSSALGAGGADPLGPTMSVGTRSTDVSAAAGQSIGDPTRELWPSGATSGVTAASGVTVASGVTAGSGSSSSSATVSVSVAAGGLSEAP
ncbi:MAG: hypothetical protein U0414_16105 [Polyangiaceae bacterium]